jgi:hypothetical protein
VGISSGIPPRVQLSDIVINTSSGQSPSVFQWDLSIAERNSEFTRTGSLNKPPTAVLTALSVLRTDHEQFGPRMPEHLSFPHLLFRTTQKK